MFTINDVIRSADMNDLYELIKSNKTNAANSIRETIEGLRNESNDKVLQQNFSI